MLSTGGGTGRPAAGVIAGLRAAGLLLVLTGIGCGAGSKATHDTGASPGDDATPWSSDGLNPETILV